MSPECLAPAQKRQSSALSQGRCLQHEATLDAEQARHAAQLDSVKILHAEAMQEVASRHAKALDEAHEKHMEHLDAVTENQQAKLREAQAEVDELRDRWDRHLASSPPAAGRVGQAKFEAAEARNTLGIRP